MQKKSTKPFNISYQLLLQALKCYTGISVYFLFLHISMETNVKVSCVFFSWPGFCHLESLLSCSSVAATAIRLISGGMFTTVPHLSAGGWRRALRSCSRIINVIQQRLSCLVFFSFLFFDSSVVVSSHRQLSTQCIPYVPQRKHIVSELQPIETPFQLVAFQSGQTNLWLS